MTHARPLLLALMMAGLAVSPALADLAPPPPTTEALAGGRAAAPDIIEVRVTDNRPPLDGYGTCQVEGKVLAVLKGVTYRVNQRVRIPVFCAKTGAPVPVGAEVWPKSEQLAPDTRVRLWLLNREPVMQQVEILPG